MGVTAFPKVPKPLWRPLSQKDGLEGSLGREMHGHSSSRPKLTQSEHKPAGSFWYPLAIEWLQIIGKLWNLRMDRVPVG